MNTRKSEESDPSARDLPGSPGVLLTYVQGGVRKATAASE